MSSMTVSKSYAVLLGLEGYARTRKKLKDVGKFFGKGKGNGEGGGVGGGRKDGVKENSSKENKRVTDTGGEGVGKIVEERVLTRR